MTQNERPSKDNSWTGSDCLVSPMKRNGSDPDLVIFLLDWKATFYQLISLLAVV